MSKFEAFWIKIITSLLVSFMTIFNLAGTGEVKTETAQINGSFSCTDALGRGVTSADGESEKLVGVFYFLWHSQHGSNRIIDISEIIKQNPNAVDSEEAWINAGGGNQQEFHFWGKPLLDYYSADDEWVYRKHVQMLTDADVDFIVIDATNGFTYSEPAKKLIDVWYEYYLEGWDVPQIAYYTNSGSGSAMNRIYDEIYNNAELKIRYPKIDELWFCLDGKPMIIGDENDVQLRPEVKNYFRIKANQWPNEDKKKDGFPWMEFDRLLTYQSVYNNDGTKIMNVSVAQHSDSVCFSKTAWYGANDRTRSWHDGENDLSENALLYGYNFAEQWDFAIKMNPDIIFVTGFNEWVAQRQSPNENAPVIFVDCATENCSRDVEPSAGIMGDNYYLQMVDYITKFKGSASRVENKNQVTIDIDGSFSQWENEKITAVYKDYRNDTAGRNAASFGNVYQLTDTSGRNDIVNMKVTEDEENLYFYVETEENLTSSTDENWMNLFINEKFVVNRISPENGAATVEKITSAGFEEAGQAQIRFEENKLMLKVKKTDVDFNGKTLFKWADNCVAGDVNSFYTKGDAAPYGRLNFVY
ncbi:MAG: hypothetical protein E7536_01185 [Ruminococcaceae bacterium]|nr:hypothetical protein [Oscillospiraceae bacterium]